ncbi:MAG: flagellar biosynthesis protein FliQ [Candidatus Delongbacteria bacterium]|nr:flagellar biosynthesis protein FliQ [Candidatus Delongbacteria bacterium]
MTQAYIVTLAKQALLLTLLLSAPMLVAALVIGLLIGILQAVTQVQEMTITYVPKIIGVFLVLVLFLPWMMNLIISFTQNLFAGIPQLIH